MKASMIFFGLFISLFYLIGFGLLGFGIHNAIRSNKAARWPTAPGSIVNVAIDESSVDDGTTYEVKVDYVYELSNKVYTGSNLAFGYAASSGREAHEKIYHLLKNSKSVEVRYDPNDPGSSVLSYGTHRSIQFTLAFAVTWLLFVFGFTLIVWLSSRDDNVLMRNLLVQ